MQWSKKPIIFFHYDRLGRYACSEGCLTSDAFLTKKSGRILYVT